VPAVSAYSRGGGACCVCCAPLLVGRGEKSAVNDLTFVLAPEPEALPPATHLAMEATV